MRIKKEPLCQSNKCFCQPMQKTDEIVSRQQDRHSHTNEIRKKKNNALYSKNDLLSTTKRMWILKYERHCKI